MSDHTLHLRALDGAIATCGSKQIARSTHDRGTFRRSPNRCARCHVIDLDRCLLVTAREAIVRQGARLDEHIRVEAHDENLCGSDGKHWRDERQTTLVGDACRQCAEVLRALAVLRAEVHPPLDQAAPEAASRGHR